MGGFCYNLKCPERHGVEDGWWNPYVSRDTQVHAEMIVGHQDYHDENLRLLRAKDTQEHAETIVVESWSQRWKGRVSGGG